MSPIVVNALQAPDIPVQWFSSSIVGSEPFGKFSTLLLFSTGYKSVDLIRSACRRFVLIVRPLQFHYSLDDRANLNRVPLRLGISVSQERLPFALRTRSLSVIGMFRQLSD
jgi:hypothetical protein